MKVLFGFILLALARIIIEDNSIFFGVVLLIFSNQLVFGNKMK
jgi:hypothetical protein